MSNKNQSEPDIIIYATRTCPYCVRAKQLLKSKGLKFKEILVDQSTKLREEMMQKSGRRTVPQIWINEHHVGGSDELVALERSGQLDKLIAKGQ